MNAQLASHPNYVHNVPKIRVVVRKRPLTSKELKDEDVLEVLSEKSLVVREIKEKLDLTKYIEEHKYFFDNCFGHNHDNYTIYHRSVKPLIECLFQRLNTTCFAYGQTGSGKTFTMMGTADGKIPGMYLLAAKDIIETMQQYPELDLVVSFYEIYGQKLQDLLDNKKEVKCLEDHNQKIHVKNLHKISVDSVQTIMNVIGQGLEMRSSGQTGANDTSSRSHAILQMELVLRSNRQLYSKMSFIDLAGSERGADTMDNDRKTRDEGQKINTSLLALKECIRALSLEKDHVPYRQSQLTKVLKDSFTGSSKTTMIANVSPASSCTEHTLNSLRYADRVKEMKEQGPGERNRSVQKKDELFLARKQNKSNKIKVDQNTLQPLEKPQPGLAKQQKLLHQQTMLHQMQGQQPMKNNLVEDGGQIYGYNPKEMKITRGRSGSNIKPQQQLQPTSAGLKRVEVGHPVSLSNQARIYQQNPSNTQQSPLHQTYSQPVLSPAPQTAPFFSVPQQQHQQLQQAPPQVSAFMPTAEPASSDSSASFLQNRIGIMEKFLHEPVSAQSVQALDQQLMRTSRSQTEASERLKKQMCSFMLLNSVSDLPTVPLPGEMDREYGENLEQMYNDHNNLIGKILKQEEDFIEKHKQNVNEVINCEKSEMQLISQVEQSGSDVEVYVQKLDRLLMSKMAMIMGLRRDLFQFNAHLQMEKSLQMIYHQRQELNLDQMNLEPDQDSAQMLIAQGNGNTNLAQNFLNKGPTEGNLLGRHNGDNAVNFEEND